MNKKTITHFLAITFLWLTPAKPLLKILLKMEKDKNDIYGEWINFNGGGFQIKTISNGKETNKQYDEWGTLPAQNI